MKDHNEYGEKGPSVCATNTKEDCVLDFLNKHYRKECLKSIECTK